MAFSSDTQPLCFILGPAYHGAGMLAWRLNHHPDVLSLGTCNPQRDEDQMCSCGNTVSTCPFWKEVVKNTGAQQDDPLNTLLPHSPFLSKSYALNSWLNGMIAVAANEVSPKCWKMVYEQAERFYGIHDKFLTLCREQARHKVFVDAERSNLKFMVMASMGFPVKGVIHLTRDPRGYSNSWKKYYPESAVEKPTVDWVATHTRIKRLQSLFPKIPFLRIKYEDLLENPEETTKKALNFIRAKDVEPEEMQIPENKSHLMGLGPQDTLGASAPKADNWRESLHPEDQERVLKVVGPLFAEFGYKRENIT